MIEPNADFRPSPLLRSPHMQSLLASAGLRRAVVRRRGRGMEEASTRHVLDCGDGVRLEAHYSPAPAGARDPVVLIHGWEGSHESVYLYSLASHLHQRGWPIVRLNLRDHGGTHALNRELFHSARMDEVYGALRAIKSLTGRPDFSLAGFSLGGNFVLRVAAWGRDHGARPARVFAVNPAINPQATTRALDRSNWLYQRYFMRKWRRSQQAKLAAFPAEYDFSDVDEMRGFEAITARFAERYTPYGTVENYFRQYTVTPQILASSDMPVTIVTAWDDPVVPISDFHGFRQLPNVELLVPRYGGHCGYVEDLRLNSWLERRIAALLESAPA